MENLIDKELAQLNKGMSPNVEDDQLVTLSFSEPVLDKIESIRLEQSKSFKSSFCLYNRREPLAAQETVSDSYLRVQSAPVSKYKGDNHVDIQKDVCSKHENSVSNAVVLKEEKNNLASVKDKDDGLVEDHHVETTVDEKINPVTRLKEEMISDFREKNYDNVVACSNNDLILKNGNNVELNLQNSNDHDHELNNQESNGFDCYDGTNENKSNEDDDNINLLDINNKVKDRICVVGIETHKDNDYENISEISKEFDIQNENSQQDNYLPGHLIPTELKLGTSIPPVPAKDVYIHPQSTKQDIIFEQKDKKKSFFSFFFKCFQIQS